MARNSIQEIKDWSKPGEAENWRNKNNSWQETEIRKILRNKENQ